ncbi:hypothetical protein TNCV_4414301 [Trichonephila clavipes]|uniref:Mos1 transposase HTH domain-containing protein n=1 Tax=Trichonephila clavipes TaxID=2585209 RepID=A0A8X6V4D4_TRICX|nr:hypothetical protein TNCV_4414301 [Trichonephila clavipes]
MSFRWRGVEVRSEASSDIVLVTQTRSESVPIALVLRSSVTSRFSLIKAENASQAAEIVNSVYGADTVTANNVQFWLRRFRSGIFDVKVAPSHRQTRHRKLR